MKKEVFFVLAIISLFFISSCTEYPEASLSPAGYIDHFDLGEDETSHNFYCSACSTDTIYNCEGDNKIRLNCQSSNYDEDYLEFKMSVQPNEKNILILETNAAGNIDGYRTTKFEWFINGISQGDVEDYRESCSYLSLDIPSQYTSLGEITLKFKNPSVKPRTTCSSDFSYIHTYTFRQGEEPDISEPECLYDEECENGYCLNMECVEGCTIDNHCTAGYICDLETNTCVTGTVESCFSNADCPTYHFCNEGECELNPDNCLTDTDCPTGQICENNICTIFEEELTNTTELTNISCTTSEECQGNLGIYYGCVEGFCAIVREPCSSDSDCPENQVCAYYGYCKDEQVDDIPSSLIDNIIMSLKLEKSVFEPNEPITLK